MAGLVTILTCPRLWAVHPSIIVALCRGNAAPLGRRWGEMALLLGADQYCLADEEEQQERSPGSKERRIGAEIAHRDGEIVCHEIGEAERHADHRPHEQ